MSRTPPAEVSRRILDLEIRSRKLVTHRVMGEYHTAFRGRGMTYKEVREYQPGDDVRFIDWNVSARLGHPYTKVFEEERELSVTLLIDLSASTFSGTRKVRRDELVAGASTLLAFAAARNGDRVGAVIFTDRIEGHVPPEKGRDHTMLLARRLLTLEPEGKGTDLAVALRFFRNTSRRKGVVFILSDFLTTGYEEELRISAARHDVVGIKIDDPTEERLPALGMLRLHDPETGGTAVVDSSDPVLRSHYADGLERERQAFREAFRRAGADTILLRTDEDPAGALHRFFQYRIKARRR